MAELEVGIHKVAVKDRLPAREHYALPPAIGPAFGKLPFDEQIAPLTKVVEAWDYPGEPSDLEAWAALDITELLPLWNALVFYVAGRMAQLNEASKK